MKCNIIIWYAYFHYKITDIFIMNTFLIRREPGDNFISISNVHVLQYSFLEMTHVLFGFFQRTDEVNEFKIVVL